MLRVAEKRAFILRNEYVGKKMSVLLEKRENEETIHGHTANFLPVKVLSKDLANNDITEVKLVENTPEGLIGEPVDVH